MEEHNRVGLGPSLFRGLWERRSSMLESASFALKCTALGGAGLTV